MALRGRLTLEHVWDLGISCYLAFPLFDLDSWKSVQDNVPMPLDNRCYARQHGAIARINSHEWWPPARAQRAREVWRVTVQYYVINDELPWLEGNGSDLEYWTDGSENGVWA